MGAAIRSWQALALIRSNPGGLVGVITAKDLARLLPRPLADDIRRDRVAWAIDLFERARCHPGAHGPSTPPPPTDPWTAAPKPASTGVPLAL